ncbi:MAG: peptidyl-prolyl cis-trans isomerase [Pseudomonadales bacterium]|nr:peptidyl-prolyl cis-trans isomerase [Pseudomonadales bacterium]
MTWLKEPLLHFLGLGALIFAFYYWTADDSANHREITISLGAQENLIRTFERTWQRPPLPTEMASLVQDLVREEIAYRESQVMGLDANDIIIRRRLRQKLELLTEDLVSLGPPVRADLESYLQSHPEDYRQPALLDFEQIYFRSEPDEATARARATDALASLLAEPGRIDPAGLGDRSLLAGSYRDVRSSELSTLFGSGFDTAVLALPLNTWAGPVRSGYGYHLLRIARKTESRIPALDEVADEVERDWMSERRRQAVDGLYERLAANYQIRIEATLPQAPAAPGAPAL